MLKDDTNLHKLAAEFDKIALELRKNKISIVVNQADSFFDDHIYSFQFEFLRSVDTELSDKFEQSRRTSVKNALSFFYIKDRVIVASLNRWKIQDRLLINLIESYNLKKS